MKRAVFAFFLLFSACASVPPIRNPFENKNPIPLSEEAPPLQILVLEVGQGDATLVIGPDNTTLLIDTGPPELGAVVVQNQMEKLGLDHLDWILLTHYDTDHIGSVVEILEKYPPQEAVLDRGTSTVQDHPIYLEYLSHPSSRLQAKPGDLLNLGGGATAEILLVNGQYKDGREIHLNPDEENESSIVILIRYGDFEYLTTGDLTGGGNPGGFESKDLESWVGEIAGDVNILHVGHHGSSTSTNEEFLNHILPEEAIISVGKSNDYGHPTDEVLNHLERTGTRVFRTDLDGTIHIQSEGEDYTLQ